MYPKDTDTVIRAGCTYRGRQGGSMPYLNEKRKAGGIAMDGSKPKPQALIKMPPPVKIPQPSVSKGK